MLRVKLSHVMGTEDIESSEDVATEVEDILGSLRLAQHQAQDGVVLPYFSDDFIAALKQVDFNNVQIAFGLAADGHVVLFVK